MSNSLQAFVHTLRFEAQDTISVELRPVDGGEFPAFTAGSHIDLHLPNGLVRSYSLSNDSRERHRYVVGVLRDRASRGGSRCVHESLRVGMPITISEPRNHFALDETATHSVLVAGGIGITCSTMSLSVGSGRHWAVFPALGWGIGLAIHGMVVFFLAGGSNLHERMVQAERDRLAAAQNTR